MRRSLTLSLVTILAATPLAAQQATPAGAAASSGLVADLLRDVGQVERKVVGLARAVPADKYGWRPAPGVRSIGEVVMHIASDNYWFPAVLGTPADPSTGIKGDDFKTATAFEKRQIPRDSSIAELERSFAFLKKTLGAVPESRLSEKVTLFGQPFTMQQALLLATVHLHEHLGQFIAYSRSNGVTPPWSQGN
jgi:uncharacterized damage-inducible protein DinB